MKEDVEKRNQQRNRETIEQRCQQIAGNRDCHPPRVRTEIRQQPFVGRGIHLHGRREARGERRKKTGSGFHFAGWCSVPTSPLSPLASRNFYPRGGKSASGKITSSGVTTPR